MSQLSLFGVQWALGDSKVCSQPLKSSPKALATRAAFPKFRILSYRDVARRLHPTLSGSRSQPSPASPSSFPTSSSLNPHGSGFGHGPGLTLKVRLSAQVWGPKLPCALCAQPTGCLGLTSSLSHGSCVPCPRDEDLHSSLLCPITCTCQFSPSWLRASSG